MLCCCNNSRGFGGADCSSERRSRWMESMGNVHQKIPLQLEEREKTAIVSQHNSTSERIDFSFPRRGWRSTEPLQPFHSLHEKED